MNSYVILSPVRNEAEHIERLLKNVVSQTVLPRGWIIVDDGSRDETGKIVESYCEKYSWIRLITRKDRGFRKSGAGIVEAFYEGFQLLDKISWDFLVKLDADLSFGADYFERCLREFSAHPTLGIGGGILQQVGVSKRFLEENPAFHVRGANKIYRKECWESIGGLYPLTGWDTLDEVKANMLGWETRSFPSIVANHHRLVGGAQGRLRDLVKNGRGCYVCGYHPLFFLAKYLRESVRRPFVIGGLALLTGFLSGYWGHSPRVDDPALLKYLRRQQRNRLFRRESIWK